MTTESMYVQFQLIMEQLLAATNASRTTLRLDVPQFDLVLETVIAEATADGISSLKGSKSITDLRNTVKPVKYLEENLKILIQDDCSTASPAPPPSLIEHYGVKAQMLGPVIENNRLIGVISIHYNVEPRHWNDQDIASLEDAMKQVEQALQSK